MKIKFQILVSMLIFSSMFFLKAYPGKVIRALSCPGKFCTGLCYDGQFLWISDYQTDLIYQIDPESGNVHHTIPSPGFWPMDMAWDGRHLWNIDKKQKKIFMIDPYDGTILNSIDSPCEDAEGLTWDGKTLWVGDAKENIFMSIDLSDGTAIQKFEGPAKSVNGLAFDGVYLWSSDRNLNEIYMIDSASGEVILIVDSPGPFSRGLTFDGEFLWNVDSQTDSIYQMIRQDDELFGLSDTRRSRITFTHQVKVYGSGSVGRLNVMIAVPGNLRQQNLSCTVFSAPGYSIKEDRWHQPVALYPFRDIPSNSTVQAIMTVEAEISAIRYFIFPDRVGSMKAIPDTIKSYTSDGTKYMIRDPEIQNLAKEIIGNEKHPYWIARKIFDYVRNHLEYKLEGGWNRAPMVLERGTGSCSEYTFSFIALARAAGLPARYAGAIVVRGDDASLDEVFHRWPEIYLPNYGWVPMDPQGGDKPSPRDRAMNIGCLSNRFLITTQGGGDSEYLGWTYNSHTTFESDPQVMVNIETFGEWEPLKDKKQDSKN